jgi:hypothetical protein
MFTMNGQGVKKKGSEVRTGASTSVTDIQRIQHWRMQVSKAPKQKSSYRGNYDIHNCTSAGNQRTNKGVITKFKIAASEVAAVCLAKACTFYKACTCTTQTHWTSSLLNTQRMKHYSEIWQCYGPETCWEPKFPVLQNWNNTPSTSNMNGLVILCQRSLVYLCSWSIPQLLLYAQFSELC